MKPRASAIDRYFTLNIHVGISVGFLGLLNFRYFPAAHPGYFFVFISLLTIAGYQIIRMLEGIQYPFGDFKSRVTASDKVFIIFTILLIISAVVYLLKDGKNPFVLLIPAILMSMTYSIPFPSLKKKVKSLRYYTWIRLLLIGFVWAWVSQIVPVWEAYREPGYRYLFISNALLVASWVIPFDIYDLSRNTNEYFTLPGKNGYTLAKKEALLLILLSFAFRFPLFERQPVHIILTDVFLYLISVFLILKSKPGQSKYYASFWVDGIPLLTWIFHLFTVYLLDS